MLSFERPLRPTMGVVGIARPSSAGGVTQSLMAPMASVTRRSAVRLVKFLPMVDNANLVALIELLGFVASSLRCK